MTASNSAEQGPGRRRFVALAATGAALAGAMGWHLLTGAPEYAGKSIDVALAHAQAVSGEVLLIDIRRPDEWERTGVGDGAHPLDMRRDDFLAELKTLTAAAPGRPIALICARGVRSARLAGRLSDAGWRDIVDVPEGMLGSGAGPGWIAAGLPVRTWEKETQ